MKSSVKAFLVRTRLYFRKNWGAPFILGFIGLLIVAIVLLIMGFSWLAEVVGNFGYFSLVAGVVLQLVCLLRNSKNR
jgi:hypothetical protein